MLCRSPLLPDESLFSYLSRLASLNRYVPFSTLTNLIRQRLTRLGIKDGLLSLQHPETFAVLETLTLTNSTELAHASFHQLARAPLLANGHFSVITLLNGQPMPLFDRAIKVKKLRRNQHAQFCPACLAEAAYHHLSWIPGDVTTCLKHRCLLLERCPHCQRWITIPDIVARHCVHCDSDLAHAMVTYIPDDSLALFAQQTIQAWWGVTEILTNQSSWTLPAEPPFTLYRLFDQLRESIRVKWSWEYVYQQTHLPPETHTIQTIAFKALTDWPHGFWDFLREYLHRERGLHQYNIFLHSAQESRLAAQLWDLGTSADFHWVQVALNQFLAENNFKIYLNQSSPRIYWSDAWRL